MLRKVVICGSYHRDPTGLQRLFRELELAQCRILSPLSCDFQDTHDTIVRLDSEASFSIVELEKYHLRALKEADIVWLHAPDGHVGLSGAYELGVAVALNKPVFCLQAPVDEMLASQIITVTSVFQALDNKHPIS